MYVVPLDVVVECLEADEARSAVRGISDHLSLRGDVLPLVRLRELFGEEPRSTVRENVIVVRYGAQSAGLLVDELLGEYQTVIKPLGRVFENLRGISGATILGSGEVAMIIDVAGLVKQVTTAPATGQAAIH